MLWLAPQPHQLPSGDSCQNLQEFRHERREVLKPIGAREQDYHCRARRDVLLSREIAIDGDKDIESLFGEGEQFSVARANSTYLWGRRHLVT